MRQRGEGPVSRVDGLGRVVIYHVQALKPRVRYLLSLNSISLAVKWAQ